MLQPALGEPGYSADDHHDEDEGGDDQQPAGQREGAGGERVIHETSAYGGFASSCQYLFGSPMRYCNLSDVAVYHRSMLQLSFPTPRLDRLAIGLSGLCLVHCLGTTIVLALLASAGGFLGAPIIHEVGLGLAMILGGLALGKGIFDHGYTHALARSVDWGLG